MNRGITLIELLVALTIGTVLIVAVTDTLRMVLVLTTQKPLSLQAIDQARTTASTFSNELRNATIGSDGSYPLAEASSTEIIFFTPYRSGTSPSVRRIRYYVASSTLYKGVTTQSGTPPSYVIANEQITKLLPLASSTTKLFTYYDESYTGSSTPLVQPVSVTNVTYVQMSLSMLRKDERNSTSTFTFTSGSSVRNLKTNLGN
jgi:prepilin-type N-terminal cleavage/methylation domain-containing protein